METPSPINFGRYYLWDPRQGISVGPYIEADPGLIRLEPFKLEEGLKALQAKAAVTGRAQRIEIHCHGRQAQLYLSSEAGVQRGNVAWLGQSLRPAIITNGLIELLACSVAAQKAKSGNLLRTEPQNIQGYVPEYHGKLQELYMDKRWENHRGLIFTGAGADPTAIKPFVPGQRYVPDPERDGLEFCRTLAKSAGATVRAAYTTQAEDGPISGDPVLMPSISPIGNWEGPVFDFFADGSVKCLGMAPFRATSFGPMRVDTDFPLKPLPMA